MALVENKNIKRVMKRQHVFVFNMDVTVGAG